MRSAEAPAGSAEAQGTAALDAPDLLRRPIGRALLRLSGPVFVSMLLHTLFNLADAAWVGRLGSASLAAVTTSIFATWTLLGLASMVSTGLVAVVARHAGAAERDRADHVSAQGILLAVLLSALLALSAPLVPSALFRLLDTPPEVQRQGTDYLRILLFGSLPAFLMIAMEGILRAHGNTRTPMLVTLGAVGLNIVIDPFLILGIGPFPALGVRGAAIATVLAQSVGAILFAVHFRRARRRYAAIPRGLRRLAPRTMARLVRIGAPPMLGTVLYSVVYLLLARVAAQLGTAPLAVLGVGNRLESFSWLTASALGAGVATLVGQNLGASRPDRARSAAHIGMVGGFAVATLIGAAFWFFGGAMFAAFTEDPEVRRAGASYMRILAICQPFMGIEIVLMGAFSGAGYTHVPSWISVGTNLLRIPLAFLVALELGLGLTGLVWVLSLTCLARGLAMLALYRRGRWLEAVV